MNLQTKIPVEKESKNLLDYYSKTLLLGSCFSKNIGDKLEYYKFQSQQNPFGILFHPKAIETLISKSINTEKYSENDFIFLNEQWHNFDAHSSLSSINKTEILENLNASISITNSTLKKATHIIITLGTSWVYRFIENDKIVANCHKVPQKKFLKELLSVNEIFESLDNIVTLVKSINKDVSFIFTVSPIRHLKDGFTENSLSKSHLITAIHKIVDKRKNIFYFPSYEIMMDELRDYRFYSEDMIHPNKTAINYIWEKFVGTWFSDKSIKTMKDVEAIQKGLLHKPFNENSKQHQQFLKSLDSKKEALTTELPFIKFS